MTDPYWKLKPLPATAMDDVCHCNEPHPIILCFVLSQNPILCAHCRGEVLPEVLKPTPDMVDEITYWRQFYSSFYYLWLDSAEFEDWARLQLSDPNSPPNKRGYKVCDGLSSIRRCYYWFFQDASREGFEPLTTCPRCRAAFETRFDRLVCNRCMIITGIG